MGRRMRGLTQRRVALRWHQARKKIRKVLGKMLSPTRREDLVLERAVRRDVERLAPERLGLREALRDRVAHLR